MRVDLVAETDDLSLIIETPDVYFVFLFDGVGGGLDYELQPDDGDDHVVALQEGLGLEVPNVERAQGFEEARHFSASASRFQPGNAGISRAVLPFHVVDQVAENRRDVATAEGLIEGQYCVD